MGGFRKNLRSRARARGHRGPYASNHHWRAPKRAPLSPCGRCQAPSGCSCQAPLCCSCRRLHFVRSELEAKVADPSLPCDEEERGSGGLASSKRPGRVPRPPALVVLLDHQGIPWWSLLTTRGRVRGRAALASGSCFCRLKGFYGGTPRPPEPF